METSVVSLTPEGTRAAAWGLEHETLLHSDSVQWHLDRHLLHPGDLHKVEEGVIIHLS